MTEIGIFSPSSVVGRVELLRGIKLLRGHGFEVISHPQAISRHFLFAGTDQARAEAMFELACNERVRIVWAARGGYGAQRLLPLLDRLTQRHGKPVHKLFVGYSDVTVLHEYVRSKWGWSCLHAPMPSDSTFPKLKPGQWRTLIQLLNGKAVSYPATAKKLTWMNRPPAKPIRAELVGGNLSLWSSLVGTPWQPTLGKKRILFFEDIGEKLYRIDRMVTQINQAGLLEGAAAIVLGDFTHCDDEKSLGLANQNSERKIPLRPTYSLRRGLEEIFVPVCERSKIPLARGLPVGHGPGYYPLPLGAKYELNPAGQLGLVEWGWKELEH